MSSSSHGFTLGGLDSGRSPPRVGGAWSPPRRSPWPPSRPRPPASSSRWSFHAVRRARQDRLASTRRRSRSRRSSRASRWSRPRSRCHRRHRTSRRSRPRPGAKGSSSATTRGSASPPRSSTTPAPGSSALLQGVASDTEELVRGLETQVVELALAIAEKVIAREARTDPEIILSVVRSALSEIHDATELRIRVNPDDCAAAGDALAGDAAQERRRAQRADRRRPRGAGRRDGRDPHRLRRQSAQDPPEPGRHHVPGASWTGSPA